MLMLIQMKVVKAIMIIINCKIIPVFFHKIEVIYHVLFSSFSSNCIETPRGLKKMIKATPEFSFQTYGRISDEARVMDMVSQTNEKQVF